MPRQEYRNKNREKLEGVTTILDRFKQQGGLKNWAYKQGRLHENLSMRGLPAPTYLYEKVNEAAASGTIAHGMIEQHILSGSAPVMLETDEVTLLAVNAFNQYLKWRSQSRIEIIATEMSLVSERYQFAGTLDAVGKDGDDIVLLDWKTSNRVYADNMIQLAAYALLLEENKPEWTPKGFHLLRVAKENAAFAHFYRAELDVEKRQFLRFVEAFKDDKLIERRL